MNDLKSRVAYLQGLSTGLELGESKEGKLLRGIIDVLDEFADTVGNLTEDQEQLEEYLERVSTKTCTSWKTRSLEMMRTTMAPKTITSRWTARNAGRLCVLNQTYCKTTTLWK